MGHTILLQWTYADRAAPLNEYILTRILERYGLSQPIRSTIQLRSFRATGGTSQTLTTVAYSHPHSSSMPRDDTTYLILDDDRSLAVRPAAAVLPLLTNLLSPFVLGLTKAARATASTTAETPRPTTLPGTPLVITSITFSTPTALLTLHNLPSPTAPTIYVEAESVDGEDVREFLDHCLPEFGEKKYHTLDGEGLERTRKLSQLLVADLRRSGFI